MNTWRCALVTGASGTIGPTLVRHLAEAGYRVRVLVRSESSAAILPETIEICRGDFTDSDSVRSAVHGVDVVFHLAAKLHVSNPSPELHAEYERVNVEGTRILVRESVSAGVGRFIYFSTINVYGEGRPGVTFNEESPPRPNTIYADTKLQGERIVQEGHPASTVLRLAAVYGPRMRGNYPVLLRALGKGLFFMLGDGSNRRTLVHVEDVARAALLVAECQEAIGKIYNVTDGSVHTFDAIARAIQRAMRKKERMLYVPAGPVRRAISVVEYLADGIGVQSPVKAALVDKLMEDMAVDGSLIQRDLDFRPSYGLEDGWAAAIA